MRTFSFAVIALALLGFGSSASAQRDYMGNWTANPFAGPQIVQPSGTFTNPFGNDAISPRLYDRDGGFRGNLNANPYDPNSIANPYGRYGSPFSPDSVNNPYGRYGSPYSPDSPNNTYGQGLGVYRR